MSTTLTTNLGIYTDRGQLDHDSAMLIDGVLDDMAGRDVDRVTALASLRRVLRGVL